MLTCVTLRVCGMLIGALGNPNPTFLPATVTTHGNGTHHQVAALTQQLQQAGITPVKETMPPEPIRGRLFRITLDSVERWLRWT